MYFVQNFNSNLGYRNCAIFAILKKFLNLRKLKYCQQRLRKFCENQHPKCKCCKWCNSTIRRCFLVTPSPLSATVFRIFNIFSSHISYLQVEKRNVIEKLERSLKIVIAHVYCQFPRTGAKHHESACKLLPPFVFICGSSQFEGRTPPRNESECKEW